MIPFQVVATISFLRKLFPTLITLKRLCICMHSADVFSEVSCEVSPLWTVGTLMKRQFFMDPIYVSFKDRPMNETSRTNFTFVMTNFFMNLSDVTSKVELQ